jgi:drug/metabolite transporter superfamily protein YnfA
MTKFTKVFAFVGVLLVVTILLVSNEDKSTTRLFCAYGKVFVEFEESHSTWGVLMLDSNGKPIPCNDNEHIEIVKQQGVSI